MRVTWFWGSLLWGMLLSGRGYKVFCGGGGGSGGGGGAGGPGGRRVGKQPQR